MHRRWESRRGEWDTDIGQIKTHVLLRTFTTYFDRNVTFTSAKNITYIHFESITGPLRTGNWGCFAVGSPYGVPCTNGQNPERDASNQPGWEGSRLIFATGHLAFLKRHGWDGGRGVLSATAVRYRIELKFPLCVDFLLRDYVLWESCAGRGTERRRCSGGRARGALVFVPREERERGCTGRKERHSSMKRASVL